MNGAPNCYNCRFRRSIPGDAHSHCVNPKITAADAISVMFLGMTAPSSELAVKGDPYGHNQGWFMWPYNFDPNWLQACNGFQPLEEENHG